MQRLPGFLPIYNKFRNKQVMTMKTQKFEVYKFNCRGLYFFFRYSLLSAFFLSTKFMHTIPNKSAEYQNLQECSDKAPKIDIK